MADEPAPQTRSIANKIIRLEREVDPSTLTPHPMNARMHPEDQQAALDESLGRVGYIDAVIVNERTGHVLDGHERVEDATERGGTVPVLYVDVEPEDEEFVLASFDPIGSLAQYNPEILSELMQRADIETEALLNVLNDQLAMLEGPPPLDDLADEYSPPGEGDPDPSWLRIEVNDELLDRWKDHRVEYETDAEALDALLS